MISYVKGRLAEVFEDSVIVEAGGFGINIRVPISLIGQLPTIGTDTMIYTYMHVREDAMSLFGFMTRDDCETFKLLLNVNGIGPKGALSILSAMSPDKLRLAILSEDVQLISSAQGIGKKTAERVVLELKDKVVAFANTTVNVELEAIKGSATNEAIEGLLALGYNKIEASKAIASIGKLEDKDTEEIIKEALKNLYR